MRLSASLRARVAAGFAVFALLFVVAQTIAVYLVTDGQEEEFIDHVLDSEMRTWVEQYRRGADVRAPHTDVMTGFIVRNSEERAKLPKDLRSLDDGTHEIFRGGAEFHVRVLELREATFYLLYDATRHETRIDEFRKFLLVAILVSAVVAAALGSWLSGRLVHEVSDLTGRVARLGPHAGISPLARLYRDEEVVKLASAFDHYHQRMAQLLNREKEFTANVSHELRTPLTAIKTGCELLAQDAMLAGKSRLRLENIRAAAERITESTQALLFLGREAPVEDDELLDVREVLEDALAAFQEAVLERNLEFEIRVAAKTLLRVNRSALNLALSNLIRNAVDYTDHGHITVAFKGDTLSVTDTGYGIAEAELPLIFERTYRGRPASRRAEGSGLGLSIVKRVVDRFGWQIRVESQLHQGSTFAITFPAASVVDPPEKRLVG
jgi:signal transduction histidine kinase